MYIYIWFSKIGLQIKFIPGVPYRSAPPACGYNNNNQRHIVRIFAVLSYQKQGSGRAATAADHERDFQYFNESKLSTEILCKNIIIAARANHSIYLFQFVAMPNLWSRILECSVCQKT